MGNISHRCCICEADFSPGALDKAGKCPICRVQYPTVNTKQEAFALNQPELRLNAKLTEERVRQIAREEFNAIRAEIKAKAEALKNVAAPVVAPVVTPVVVNTPTIENGFVITANQETTNV